MTRLALDIPVILFILRLFRTLALDDDLNVTANTSTQTVWSYFLNICETLAPCCGILCFLAPMPTIRQISRDKSIGNLPLLPYSSMVANSFVWVSYGLLKKLKSVFFSNAVGVALGAYYCVIFTRYCGPMAKHLPGTVGQHLKGTTTIILFNLFLVGWLSKDTAGDIIGKEGVLFCTILFASPLVALKHVVVSKSAASIPLPFTIACFINCAAWSVVGIWSMMDFNIYFPNLMGLSCAIAQLVLKCLYRDQAKSRDLPK